MINVSSNSADLPASRQRTQQANSLSHSSTKLNSDSAFSDQFDLNLNYDSMHSMMTSDMNEMDSAIPPERDDVVMFMPADNQKPSSILSHISGKDQDSHLLFKNPVDGYDFSEDLNMDMFTNSPAGLLLNPIDPHNIASEIPLDSGNSPMHLYNSSIASSPSSSNSSAAEVKHEPSDTRNNIIYSADNSEQYSPSPSQRSSISIKKDPIEVSNESVSSSSSSINHANNFSTTSPATQTESVKVKREVSEALANYQFGRELTSDDSTLIKQPTIRASVLPAVKPSHSNAWPNPPSYMPEFNPTDWRDTSGLKYGLQIQDVPSKSRVETQIKVVMNFYPPPSQTIVHLPADTISKPKLQLRTPFVPIPSALTVDTVVVCDSDLNHYVNICQGCMKRERKRAFRKKVRLPIEEAHWQQDKEKRAIVFNCREVVDFGPLVDIEVNGQTVQSRQIELPMRMACYCRHHNEKNGFRAFFVVRDHMGSVVARGSTKSIMITDDHKATNMKTSNAGIKRPNTDIDTMDFSVASTSNSSPVATEVQPTVSELTQDSQPASRKRKTIDIKTNTNAAQPSTFTIPKDNKLTAVPQRHRSTANSPQAFSPISTPNFEFALHSPISPRASNTSSIYHRTSSLDNLAALMSRPVSAIPSPKESPVNVLSPPKQSVDEWAAQDNNLPTIQRIIPASGSIRGGIEVTLLGSGFINGLVTKFGENKSMTTHCWNSSTIVTNLPPSRVAGPVVVTFEGFAMPDPQVFSYYDDTDRQLIELALQVVGLKMNGRLEDARDIARRIVGSGTGFDPNQVQLLENSTGTYNRATGLSLESLDNLLLKCLDLIDTYNSDFTPNWQLSNCEGQTMLHLAACLGLPRFSSALLSRGISLDIQDKSGFTALHFAALNQNEHLISMFLRHGARPEQRTYTGLTYYQLQEDPLPTPITQKSFEFNDDGESSSSEDSEYSHENDEEVEEGETGVDNPDKPRGLASYFASWRDSAVFRMGTPSNEGADEHTESTDESTDSNLWNLIYRNILNTNTGDISNDARRAENVLPPPSYEEIFPAGSSSNADFSSASLDEEKPAAATEVQAAVEVETEPSEEEVLEAWKNKRKKIQNDRMFLFFWLPVFIFMLVWVSMKAVTFFDTVDASAHLHEKITAVIKGFSGVKKFSQVVPSTSFATSNNHPPPEVLS